MLNDKEIELFKENIFTELRNNDCDISKCKTIMAYKNIENFLHICLFGKLSAGIYKYTKSKRTIDKYKNIFYEKDLNRNYNSLDFVYKNY